MSSFDAVRQTSISTGTGNITLRTASTGFRNLVDVHTVSTSTIHYCLEGRTSAGAFNGQREIGIGRLSTGSVFQRLSVEMGSTGATFQNFTGHSWLEIADSVSVSAVMDLITTATLSLTQIPVPKVGAVTEVITADDVFDRAWSSGSVEGFGLTDNGDGTVTIAAGEGVLRTSDLEDAPLVSVAVSSNTLIMVSGAASYIYFDYNGGTPVIATSTLISDFNCTTKCHLYTVTREGTTLNVLDARNMNVDSNRKHRRMLYETEFLQHTKGGTVLADAGALAITVSSGAFYYGLQKQSHGAFDTTFPGVAAANVFGLYYRDGGAGWTKVSDQKTLDSTQYDDGSGVLATLTNNRYRTDWVYLVPDITTPKLAVVLGTNNDNSFADAEARVAPTSLPPVIAYGGVLVGRCVVLKNAAEIQQVASAFQYDLASSVAPDHNDLGGLQGGTVNEYYHLTSVQQGYVSGMDVYGASLVSSTSAGMARTTLGLTDVALASMSTVPAAGILPLTTASGFIPVGFETPLVSRSVWGAGIFTSGIPDADVALDTFGAVAFARGYHHLYPFRAYDNILITGIHADLTTAASGGTAIFTLHSLPNRLSSTTSNASIWYGFTTGASVAVFSSFSLEATGLHTVTGTSITLTRGQDYAIGMYLPSLGTLNPQFRCQLCIAPTVQTVREIASTAKGYHDYGFIITASTPVGDIPGDTTHIAVSSAASVRRVFPVTLKWEKI